MASKPNHEDRLLVSLIDDYAALQPWRVWAVVPVDVKDQTKGFTPITYGALGNAINHAVSWLLQNLPLETAPSGTIAYTGPKDIRYPILAIAAAKVGRKLLLPSPFASVAAQAHLIEASGCRTYLYGANLESNVQKVLSAVRREQPTTLKIPELAEFLDSTPAKLVPFTKTWEEAKDDPWLVFHTSGTTGLPKLVTYTHRMMATLNLAESMPDASRENMKSYFENKRWYTPLPSLHIVGMTIALQSTVYWGAILVVGPATPGPISPAIAHDTIKYGQVDCALLPPALIDGLCGNAAGLQCLRNLEFLYFGGAPLGRKTAEKLLGHVMLKPAMGSTEAGVYFLQIVGEKDWEYYTFRPSMGLELRRVTDGFYEPVFVRQPALQRWQPIFQVYPNLQEFPTKDLFSPHPTKANMWKYVGRTDDMITLSHGENLYTAGIEEVLATHPDIAAVLVGGQGKARPFVLIEWKEDMPDELRRTDRLLPILEKANEGCSELVKLRPALVLFTSPDRKLVRNAKGAVVRRESERAYAEEIERLYRE